MALWRECGLFSFQKSRDGFSPNGATWESTSQLQLDWHDLVTGTGPARESLKDASAFDNRRVCKVFESVHATRNGRLSHRRPPQTVKSPNVAKQRKNFGKS